MSLRTRRGTWILYTAALILAVGSRQLNVVLAAWLPLALVLAHARWTVIGQSVAVGFAAIGFNIALSLSLCHFFQIPYQTTLGRTLSDRVDTFLAQLPSEERLKLAERLTQQTSDAQTREAILYQAITGPYYSGMKVGDAAVLSSSITYLKTLHPALLKVVAHDFWRGLVATNRRIALSPFFSNRWGAKDAFVHPQYWTGLEGYRPLEIKQAERLWSQAKANWYLKLCQHINLWVVLAMTLVLFIFNHNIQVLWALVFGAFTFLINMVCVYYSDRYALSLLVPLVIAFAIAVGSSMSGFHRLRTTMDTT